MHRLLFWSCLWGFGTTFALPRFLVEIELAPLLVNLAMQDSNVWPQSHARQAMMYISRVSFCFLQMSWTLLTSAKCKEEIWKYQIAWENVAVDWLMSIALVTLWCRIWLQSRLRQMCWIEEQSTCRQVHSGSQSSDIRATWPVDLSSLQHPSPAIEGRAAKCWLLFCTQTGWSQTFPQTFHVRHLKAAHVSL